MPELPDRLAEPFAAVQAGHLVHTERAFVLRRRFPPGPRSRKRPRSFTLAGGNEVAFLPPYDPAKEPVSLEDVSRIAAAHPEFQIFNAVQAAADGRDRGSGDFLQQVERARAYLRTNFWKLKRERKGYAAGWLKHQAEEHRGGTYRGYVGELALIAAALLDDLRTEAWAGGEHGTVFR